MPSSTKSKPTEEPQCPGPFADWCSQAEKCARQEPLKCSLIAFLGGLLLTILPVGAVVSLLVRAVLALVRPFLIVLGAMKIFEEIEKRRKP